MYNYVYTLTCVLFYAPHAIITVQKIIRNFIKTHKLDNGVAMIAHAMY
jgi:succinate dehydrogenase hydrophobic anchor subunit